jgi:flagellar basal-body rod protein FlgB
MGLIKALLFNNRMPQIAKQAISLQAQRASIAAANISNAETPGYKAQKFEFESALQSAVSGGTLPMTSTNISHITGPVQDIKSIKGVTDVDLTPGRIDGNNVDLDKEVVNFSDAHINYSAIVTAMTSRGASTRSAITDAR